MHMIDVHIYNHLSLYIYIYVYTIYMPLYFLKNVLSLIRCSKLINLHNIFSVNLKTFFDVHVTVHLRHCVR
jgi:hypothetical protein